MTPTTPLSFKPLAHTGQQKTSSSMIKATAHQTGFLPHLSQVVALDCLLLEASSLFITITISALIRGP